MNEKDISSKEKDLSVDSNADSVSNDASTTYDKDTTSERPRHDTLIRKAFENPIVAKEFFEMHL